MNTTTKTYGFNSPPWGELEGALVPAIIQDAVTNNVLMLGYMNAEALLKTTESGKVTFYSRSKERLWTKGEESGNFLNVVSIKNDCDKDTLLVKVNPQGPTCHTGSDTCWNEENTSNFGFISQLEAVIEQRRTAADGSSSYVASLFEKGINKIAQKVGEEAVEAIIEATKGDKTRLMSEAADVIYHLLVMCAAHDVSLDDIEAELANRTAQSGLQEKANR